MLFRCSFCFSFLPLLLLLSSLQTYAQTPDNTVSISVSPQKGIELATADGFMAFRMGFRLQQQIRLSQLTSQSDALAAQFLVRRARSIFHGYLFYGKLGYVVQLGMDQGSLTLLNAEYRWKPNTNTQFSFGQFLPPTTRQTQTISKNFQMVEASAVTKFFFTDFVKGIKLQQKVALSDRFLVKLSGALTDGEGRNVPTASGGWAYMGRMEILPLGAFEQGGDYMESDLAREKTPKISLGAGFYVNHDAYTTLGNLAWDGYDDDITDRFADVLVKYNGFSLLAEFITRHVDNQLLTVDGTTYLSNKVGGHGFYAQAGTFVSAHLEPTISFSYLNPNDLRQNAAAAFSSQTKSAVGLNYFFLGHGLKLQSQVGFVSEDFTLAPNRRYLEMLAQFTFSF